MDEKELGAYALKAENARKRLLSCVAPLPPEFRKHVEDYAEDVPRLLKEAVRLKLAEEVAAAAVAQRLALAEAERLGREKVVDGGSAGDKEAIDRHRAALSEAGTASSHFLAALERYQRFGTPLGE